MKTMLDLKVGDQVFAASGKPTLIVATTEILNDRPCYRVTFSSGEEIICDASHLWIVRHLGSQNTLVLDTATLALKYRIGVNNRAMYGVDLAEPVEQGYKELPITPYVLGVLLGDGYIAHNCVEFVSGDQEIVDFVRDDLGSDYILKETDVRSGCINYSIQPAIGKTAHIAKRAKGWHTHRHTQTGKFMGFVRSPGGSLKYIGYWVDKAEAQEACINYPGERYSQEEMAGAGLYFELGELGLLGKKSATKFIPEIYKTASYYDRLLLLQGLMDTDGSIDPKRGRVEFTSISRQLALDVHELCCSLGIKSHIGEKTIDLKGNPYIAWRVHFTSPVPVFRMQRKAKWVKQDLRSTQFIRYIEKIEEVPSVPVKCIEVENEDGSYLITRSYIVTHNSRVGAEKVHAYLKKYPNTMGLMMRKQRQSMTNSTVLFFERTVVGPDPGVVHFPSKFRFEYSNGSILAYGGMDGDEQKEQIRSIGATGGLHITWLEEANRFVEDDFNEILARMRGSGVTWRQIILTTNPDAPMHWIYRRLIVGGEAKVYYSKAADNSYNPNEYVGNLQKLTGVTKARLADGKWVQAEGAVYPDFDPSRHIIDPFEIPDTWRRVRGVDFGLTNPFVCLWAAIDDDGRIYIYREIYMTQRTVKRHSVTINAETGNEETEITVCDWDAEDRMTLDEEGIYNIQANKDVAYGINLITERLQWQADDKARLYIFRNCLVEPDEALRGKRPMSITEEFPSYAWAKDLNGGVKKDQPQKVNDHAMDCLRYIAAYVDSGDGGGMDVG